MPFSYEIGSWNFDKLCENKGKKMTTVFKEIVVLTILQFEENSKSWQDKLALCLIYPILYFSPQGIYMMYLYVGSIVAIMCIYISVLLDNCPGKMDAKKW